MEITIVDAPEHERVVEFKDNAVGLLGYIAIHSTQRGPAAGGVRMRPYGHPVEALNDALRLARGMTFKNAAADLPLGGGKAVIIGDPKVDKSPELLQAFGQVVQSLSGQYWTAEDMGMTPADMAHIGSATGFVAGLAEGAFASGDPSPITARGIFNAIRVTAMHRFGQASLNGLTVSVQGLGHVGEHLCRLLHDAGAQLIVTDIDTLQSARMAELFSAQVVAPDAIYSVKADIFAPCAIGGILNETSIPTLQVGAVAGGANNQLARSCDAQALHQRGILYAPDFVANGGGIVNVATEILRVAEREAWVDGRLQALEQTMDRILMRAKVEAVSPHEVAETIVHEMLRLQAA
ncbi:Glu/Leu/Phe/Val dehydrogenase dimerization domain-containing protein [uncultured Ruegeria sp.]|uniref:Glu/Leu/Phe/Val family dehydrogenase n=1 Tax=uncultured Ruegeria sp. TaxID=259304 RepID=UPI002631ED0E|nr:Glu/Leu/Phe/Val dehydrogenase dimerization domain-containing protein [uncultured Ruegeria sp.]